MRTEQLTARPGLDAAYAGQRVRVGRGDHRDGRPDRGARRAGGRVLASTRTLRSTASQPGLGTILGARVLAEFGDDPDRYADAKARKNYAGTSPITRASGTKRVVLARHARNRRLADALYQQAFAALTGSPGARAYYDRHRAAAPPTTKPSAPSPTGSSASSTAASATTPSTTNTSRGQDNKNTSRLLLLDTNDPWDI